jgi:hypothetical protein
MRTASATLPHCNDQLVDADALTLNALQYMRMSMHTALSLPLLPAYLSTSCSCILVPTTLKRSTSPHHLLIACAATAGTGQAVDRPHPACPGARKAVTAAARLGSIIHTLA